MTVVSNTSPPLHLALIERLHLTDAQFGEVAVPTAVWNELTVRFDDRDRIEAFRDQDGIRVVSPEATGSESSSSGNLIADRFRPSRTPSTSMWTGCFIGEREGQATATHHITRVTRVGTLAPRPASRSHTNSQFEPFEGGLYTIFD